MKKKILIVCAFFIALCWAIFFISLKKNKIHLAIIPHFMIDTQKVDEFYSLIHDKRYSTKNPNAIVLISPNHFYWQNWNISTTCKDWELRYLAEKINSKMLKNLPCEKNVFKIVWDNTVISEHGLGEHFRWINKYFPWTIVYPMVASPKAMEYTSKQIAEIQKLHWNILVIASVDFTHYLQEDITYEHDEHSIQVLTSMTWTTYDFYNLDVDCPSCLFIMNELWKISGQTGQFRYRDSSSTIAWEDLWEENTSRVFMYYE